MGILGEAIWGFGQLLRLAHDQNGFAYVSSIALSHSFLGFSSSDCLGFFSGYNKSDGDPWDVFAPGYSYTLSTSNSYRIKKILGILLLENGNHKIAVKLYASQAPGFNYKRAMKEIQ